MAGYDKGSHVSWSWGNGTGDGKIIEKFINKISKTIKGTEVTREASASEPAYLIEQDDGDKVLKSHSEVSQK